MGERADFEAAEEAQRLNGEGEAAVSVVSPPWDCAPSSNLVTGSWVEQPRWDGQATFRAHKGLSRAALTQGTRALSLKGEKEGGRGTGGIGAHKAGPNNDVHIP